MLKVFMLLCLTSVSLLAQQPNPALLQRYFEEGEKALAAGQYAQAEKAYAELRELDPQIPEVHVKLGLIYFQQGKFAEAVPALRQALKLKPTLPNADILLAMSLSEMGRYNQALPGLERCWHSIRSVRVFILGWAAPYWRLRSLTLRQRR